MENSSKNKSFYAKIILLLTAILWGTSLTVVKSAADVFKPNMILAIRFTIASIILASVFHKKLFRARKYEISAGLVLRAILFISYMTQTIGVTYTTPGRSGFLTASYCVLVPFVYWMVAKIKPDKFNIIAAVLCVFGISGSTDGASHTYF